MRIPIRNSYDKAQNPCGGRRGIPLRDSSVQSRSRGLRSRYGVQRRTGPRHAPRTLFADSARRHDGRDERIQDGPAAPGAARNGRRADHLLHGQRHRGRHGRGAQHRSRRLYRQAFLRARSAGPRALRAAPHRRRARAGRSRSKGCTWTSSAKSAPWTERRWP